MSQYVAVIGTGIMAAGIAAGFISHSIPVVILGRSKDKSADCLKKAIQLAFKIGLHGENASLDAAAIEATQVSATTEDWETWSECSWVIETVAETLYPYYFE